VLAVGELTLLVRRQLGAEVFGEALAERTTGVQCEEQQ
jgi:hypothetical protein